MSFDLVLQNARVKHFSEWWDQYVEQAIIGQDFTTYRQVMFLVGSLIRRVEVAGGERGEEQGDEDCGDAVHRSICVFAKPQVEFGLVDGHRFALRTCSIENACGPMLTIEDGDDLPIDMTRANGLVVENARTIEEAPRDHG